MSVASREELLVRIYTLMGEADSALTKVRNRGLLQNEARPAQVLLDGDEVPVLSSLTGGNRRGRAMTMLPQIMRMTPQLFYLPKEKRPLNSDPKNIGTEANAWREKVLDKIWNDTVLAGLIGSNGSLVYNGCETDMKSGSAMSGEIRLDFAMQYVLQP